MTTQVNLNDDELGLAIAALIAVMVKTMNGQDNTFAERFIRNLGIMYKEIRDKGEISHMGTLEVLSWTDGYVKDLDIY